MKKIIYYNLFFYILICFVRLQFYETVQFHFVYFSLWLTDVDTEGGVTVFVWVLTQCKRVKTWLLFLSCFSFLPEQRCSSRRLDKNSEPEGSNSIPRLGEMHQTGQRESKVSPENSYLKSNVSGEITTRWSKISGKSTTVQSLYLKQL